MNIPNAKTSERFNRVEVCDAKTMELQSEQAGVKAPAFMYLWEEICALQNVVSALETTLYSVGLEPHVENELQEPTDALNLTLVSVLRDSPKKIRDQRHRCESLILQLREGLMDPEG